jgi:hypothetical protein
MDNNRSKYLRIDDVNLDLLDDKNDLKRENLKRKEKMYIFDSFRAETIKFKQKIITFQICKKCGTQRRGNISVNNWMIFVTDKAKTCPEHIWIKESDRY